MEEQTIQAETLTEEQFKDQSLKVTQSEKFGKTIGDLRVYNEDLTPVDYDSYPKITITAGEDLDKFQHGIIRITTKHIVDGGIIRKKTFLIQVDGLMSIVYAVYAKTLNDLRRATIRQKTVRVWGIIRKVVEHFRRKF